MGRKRVRRLMAKMGLTVIYPKPRTSQPHPENRVYPYLLRDLAVSRPDQVWCADVTYIPMRRGFLYLVAIMDWYSRGFCPGGCRTRWSRSLVARHSRRRSTGTITRRSSIRTRGVSSPARSSRDYSRRPGCVSRWTEGPLDGQHLHRASVAFTQIRMRLSERFRNRVGGPSRDRPLDQSIQQRETFTRHTTERRPKRCTLAWTRNLSGASPSGLSPLRIPLTGGNKNYGVHLRNAAEWSS